MRIIEAPTEINGVRHYPVTDQKGRRYVPSVSTITKSFVSQVELDMIATLSAASGITREEHFHRGNTVEAAIDAFIDGRDSDAGEFEPWMELWRPWATKTLDFGAGFTRQERVCSSLEGFEYAGAYDFLGWTKKGEQILIDWKAPRSRRQRGSAQCQQYLMQAAAYASALEIETTAVVQVVYLLPGKKPHVMKMAQEDIMTSLEMFVDRLVWHYAGQSQVAA